MKTHLVFWSIIPVLLLVGFLAERELTFLFGTDLVESSLSQLFIWTSVFLLFCGGGYFIFRKLEMNKWFIHLHIWPCLIGIAYFLGHALGLTANEPSDVSAMVMLLIGFSTTCYLINMTICTLESLLKN